MAVDLNPDPMAAVRRQFYRVAESDATVRRAIDRRVPLEALVVALAKDKEIMAAEIKKLAAIAPCRYKLPDGKVVVWHCPDNLIPEKTL